MYRLSYPLFLVSGLQDLSETITTATLELYNRIVRDLPPTPSKFHYIFNLRDLSRIYHGLSLITPDRFDNPDSLVRVWRNECHRVFYDRLTNDKDRTLVKVILLVLLLMFYITYIRIILVSYYKNIYQIIWRKHYMIHYCLVIIVLLYNLINLVSMKIYRTMMQPRDYLMRYISTLVH